MRMIAAILFLLASTNVLDAQMRITNLIGEWLRLLDAFRQMAVAMGTAATGGDIAPVPPTRLQDCIPQ